MNLMSSFDSIRRKLCHYFYLLYFSQFKQMPLKSNIFFYVQSYAVLFFCGQLRIAFILSLVYQKCFCLRITRFHQGLRGISEITWGLWDNLGYLESLGIAGITKISGITKIFGITRIYGITSISGITKDLWGHQDLSNHKGS